METIIHEILHTCKGCMNHGKEWKRLANIVYQKSGYRITTTSAREKFGLESTPAKVKNNYVFVCEDCGQVIRRDRFSKFCQHYMIIDVANVEGSLGLIARIVRGRY